MNNEKVTATEAITALGELATFLNRHFPSASVLVDGEVRNAVNNMDVIRHFILDHSQTNQIGKD